MPHSPSSLLHRYRFIWASLALIVALLIPFHGLLSPSEVMFANDGPFGMMKNHEKDGFDNFMGVWMSDNWIGMAHPGAVPTLSHLIFYLVTTVVYGKILVPFSLFFLGLSAAFFCFRAGFHPAVGILVALAAALNSNPFSFACWGLAPQAVTLGFILLALGLLIGVQTSDWKGWVQILLAGFCVGFNVMEGADVGAILSLYVAAFVAFQIWAELSGKKSVILGLGRLSVVAIAAAWIASHSLYSLVSTQIQGIAHTSNQPNSSEAQWAFATSFSFPPTESIRFLVSGIFGYRMDTPDGGAYWGGFGPDGNPQNRFNGGGEYAGVLVLLIAGFAMASALRGSSSPLSQRERRWVWFWVVVAFGSLYLAWGRFEPSIFPIYRMMVALPYFSTIRGPYKFLHGMHLALWILSAYGFEALARSCLKVGSKRTADGPTSFADRWAELPSFERNALKTMLGLIVVAVLSGAIYSSMAGSITRSIDSVTIWYGDKATSAFSISEVWISCAFLAVSAGILALTFLGLFQQSRAVIGWCALGVVLSFDLVRANLPWVKHYDYIVRHDTNPLIDKLRDRPWEHRVTAFLRPQRDGLLVANQDFSYLSKEWLENHFQFYHIQALDIDQMPRPPELEVAYFSAMTPPNFELAFRMAAIGTQIRKLPSEQAEQVRSLVPDGRANLFYVTRLWQLTNTRYILGWREGIDMFNDLFDPQLKRFKIALAYQLKPKPGMPASNRPLAPAEAAQWITAEANPNGQLALIEFEGALPRARLYTHWESMTNSMDILTRLTSPAFDPASSVLITGQSTLPPASTNTPPGTVSFTGYDAKRVQLKTTTTSPQILLLNDRWHEDWQATIDGKPTELLRANFIMRGVAVPAGEHTVEFQYRPPHSTLWVSLTAVGAGAICLIALGFASTRNSRT
jgi:hypothetical protein